MNSAAVLTIYEGREETVAIALNWVRSFVPPSKNPADTFQIIVRSNFAALGLKHPQDLARAAAGLDTTFYRSLSQQ